MWNSEQRAVIQQAVMMYLEGPGLKTAKNLVEAVEESLVAANLPPITFSVYDIAEFVPPDADVYGLDVRVLLIPR